MQFKNVMSDTHPYKFVLGLNETEGTFSSTFSQKVRGPCISEEFLTSSGLTAYYKGYLSLDKGRPCEENINRQSFPT